MCCCHCIPHSLLHPLDEVHLLEQRVHKNSQCTWCRRPGTPVRMVWRTSGWLASGSGTCWPFITSHRCSSLCSGDLARGLPRRFPCRGLDHRQKVIICRSIICADMVVLSVFLAGWARLMRHLLVFSRFIGELVHHHQLDCGEPPRNWVVRVVAFLYPELKVRFNR